MRLALQSGIELSTEIPSQVIPRPSHLIMQLRPFIKSAPPLKCCKNLANGSTLLPFIPSRNSRSLNLAAITPPVSNCRQRSKSPALKVSKRNWNTGATKCSSNASKAFQIMCNRQTSLTPNFVRIFEARKMREGDTHSPCHRRKYPARNSAVRRHGHSASHPPLRIERNHGPAAEPSRKRNRRDREPALFCESSQTVIGHKLNVIEAEPSPKAVRGCRRFISAIRSDKRRSRVFNMAHQRLQPLIIPFQPCPSHISVNIQIISNYAHIQSRPCPKSRRGIFPAPAAEIPGFASGHGSHR